MQLLRENFELIYDSKLLKESAEKNDGKYIFENVVIQAWGKKNANGRVYPENILKKEMQRYRDEVANKNRSLGEIDHSDSTIVELRNGSHVVKNVRFNEPDRTIRGYVEILDQLPMGKVAIGYVNSGIPLGISSRAIGNVKKEIFENEEVDMVTEDFHVVCFDLVSNESTPGAHFGANIKEQFEKKITDEEAEKILNTYKINNIMDRILKYWWWENDTIWIIKTYTQNR